MKNILKYVIGILTFNLLFVGVIFMLPYIMVLLGYDSLMLAPTLFEIEIFSAHIGKSVIESSIGPMGVIIVSLSSIIYTLITTLVVNKLKRNDHVSG